MLKLKIGAKVMLTVNIDIEELLINSKTGIASHIIVTRNIIVWKYGP